MTSMTTTTADVTVGVDTHGQTHHAAALDPVGRQLGDREFPTTPAGYRALLSCKGMAILSGSAWRGPGPTQRA